MDLFNSALGKNISFVRPAYFIIRGFSGIFNINYYYIFLFFVYIGSVLGNITVMAVIYMDTNLRTPKYIAVFNLAFVDLFSSSALVPKVLDIFLFNHPYISYNDCMTFFFFCYSCASMQSLNLVILSYDRLIASVTAVHPCASMQSLNLVILSYDRLIAIIYPIGLFTRLSFCKSVIIQSYFCDYAPMYQLACNDNRPSYFYGTALTVLILGLPMFFILITYGYIAFALAKIAKARDRLKAIKTCTAHLSLVAIYYLPNIFTFLFHRITHPNVRIINLSLAFVIPPMLNPIIYVLQTQEIKESVKKLLKIRV
ncbi:hypothetical protein LDENG_00220770 [Lucifuga dentata]|nr:hypothetical protein LDENG_00220770 [Lucifuga dentata]